MIDNDAVFPLKIAVGSDGGPGFSTEVTETASGHERRNQNWENPRLRWNIATGVRDLADYQELHAFFVGRKGRARGFRFRDWADQSSGGETPTPNDQLLGAGDGSRIFWQLCKVYGSGATAWVRPITRPVPGTVRVALGGIEQLTGWTVDSATGMITFTAAPAIGIAVTAGFLFDVPARFDTDTLSPGWLMTDLVQIPDLGVVELREP
jgi:uncharacterized protein (TIGR02217 family)